MMAQAVKLLTAEEFWELPSHPWSELIDGVVVELSPPAGGHGREQIKVAWALRWAEERGLGYVLGVQLVRSLTDRVTLGADDTLEGGEAVPGFSCRVADLFD